MKTGSGVGTELAKLIPDWALQFKGSCGCRDMQAQMDKRGTKWCRMNEGKIVQHLLEQEEHLVPFLRLVPAFAKKVTAQHMLRTAIASVEAREAS
jgi:hypothetical protein